MEPTSVATSSQSESRSSSANRKSTVVRGRRVSAIIGNPEAPVVDALSADDKETAEIVFKSIDESKKYYKLLEQEANDAKLLLTTMKQKSEFDEQMAQATVFLDKADLPLSQCFEKKTLDYEAIVNDVCGQRSKIEWMQRSKLELAHRNAMDVSQKLVDTQVNIFENMLRLSQ